MNTQIKQIYDLMIDDYKNGAKGINSVYIRETYFIVDVATRMFDNKENFKKLGLEYDKRLERNRTATYFLKRLGALAPNHLEAPTPLTRLSILTQQIPDDDLVRVEKIVNGVPRVFWELKDNKQQTWIV